MTIEHVCIYNTKLISSVFLHSWHGDDCCQQAINTGNANTPNTKPIWDKKYYTRGIFLYNKIYPV